MLITIFQIAVSIAIIGLILLQERSTGLGGILGGENSFYQTRRGLEKIVFWATIFLIVVFAALAILQLYF